jgi:hypothetical protein
MLRSLAVLDMVKKSKSKKVESLCNSSKEQVDGVDYHTMERVMVRGNVKGLCTYDK